MEGRVIKSTGLWYEVKTNEGIFQARVRGKFRLDEKKVTNPIAVGDIVSLSFESDNVANIDKIQHRKNYIIRKATKKRGFHHIIASNLDQAVLIASLKKPVTSLGFIDRFLVTAESYGIPSVIIFNKTDLLDQKGAKKLENVQQMYEDIGYKTLKTSVTSGIGISEFHALFDKNITLVAGNSGVGKSSLINTLNPVLDLATSEISSHTNKGQHTTTFAEMHEIKPDTYVIDSPGIKELGFSEIEKHELSHFFPEMRELLGDCKFNNCLHLNEPSCSVKEAVIHGRISSARYNSYAAMIEEELDD